MFEIIYASLTVIAILVSPLLALVATEWRQKRNTKSQLKKQLFWELYGGRYSPVSDNYVKALNLIDVVYDNNKEVRRLWADLYDMFSDEGRQNENGFKARNHKTRQMMMAMAEDIGLGSTISSLDMERVYIPEGLSKRLPEDQQFVDDMHAAALTIVQQGMAGSQAQGDVEIKTPRNVGVSTGTDAIPTPKSSTPDENP